MDVRRLAELSPAEERALLDRDAGVDAIRDDVREIIDRVRREGDAALRTYAAEFDGVEQDAIEITDRLAASRGAVEPSVLDAIQTAAESIRSFHERQRRDDWFETVAPGRELGRRFRPVERVGVYVPGGRAAYPSSALMAILPAVVAGVEHIAVATPPAERPHPATLAAIDVAGADRLYATGGAQAIAALAYGTATVDPVEKIVGPGNRWVTAAKAAVRGTVDIDFLAGPSEILVVADETADPAFVAADMLAQAEHDPDCSVVAVTDDAGMAASIVDELDLQRSTLKRGDVIAETLANPASGILLADSMDAAVAFANAYAAEHLSVQARDAEALADRIHSAASVFLGPYTPVAAGDYASGTNHVLPTGGAARLTGGLSVDTFLRASTMQRLDREGLSSLRGAITTLAETEGLDAHARSVDRRFED